MYSQEALEKIEAELSHASAARANGNEGQARVRARRAAGIAIREFLMVHHKTVLSPSATDLLNWVQSQSTLPEEARAAARTLLQRVDTDFRLPKDVDLLVEARNLIVAMDIDTFPVG